MKKIPHKKVVRATVQDINIMIAENNEKHIQKFHEMLLMVRAKGFDPDLCICVKGFRPPNAEQLFGIEFLEVDNLFDPKNNTLPTYLFARRNKP